MKIWKLENQLVNYESFQLLNTEKEFFNSFSQKVLSGKALNGELDMIEIDLAEKGIICDAPKFWAASGTMLISEKAKKCLEGVISKSGELIPLKYKDRLLYLINITKILDVLDYDKSEFMQLSTGLVYGISKYSFIFDKLQENDIFKVMLNGRIFTSEIFVTDKIKKIIEENNLTGFKFTEV